MKNSSRYFENRDCEYFPCHDKEGDFNCMFCYCPMYGREVCPGKPDYIESNGKRIKDCSGCTFPHEPENYEVIMRLL